MVMRTLFLALLTGCATSSSETSPFASLESSYLVSSHAVRGTNGPIELRHHRASLPSIPSPVEHVFELVEPWTGRVLDTFSLTHSNRIFGWLESRYCPIDTGKLYEPNERTFTLIYHGPWPGHSLPVELRHAGEEKMLQSIRTEYSGNEVVLLRVEVVDGTMRLTDGASLPQSP